MCNHRLHWDYSTSIEQQERDSGGRGEVLSAPLATRAATELAYRFVAVIHILLKTVVQFPGMDSGYSNGMPGCFAKPGKSDAIHCNKPGYNVDISFDGTARLHV